VYVNIPRCRCGVTHVSTDGADYLFALRANDGSHLWSTVISSSIETLVPTSTLIYTGSWWGGGITAVRPNDGAILWHQQLPQNLSRTFDAFMDTLVVNNQALYVSITRDSRDPNSAEDDDSIVAFNGQTRRTIWQDRGCPQPSGSSSSARCYWYHGFPKPAITVLLPV